MGIKSRRAVAGEPCLCRRTRGHWSYGDSPVNDPAFRVLDGSNGAWTVACRACGTRWSVAHIHGGGIYGDFEWVRESPPTK